MSDPWNQKREVGLSNPCFKKPSGDFQCRLELQSTGLSQCEWHVLLLGVKNLLNLTFRLVNIYQSYAYWKRLLGNILELINHELKRKVQKRKSWYNRNGRLPSLKLIVKLKRLWTQTGWIYILVPVFINCLTKRKLL